MATLWEGLSDPWRACLEEAWAAYCAGSIPVGAVITDRDGRMLVRARNRTYERDGVVSEIQVSPLAHAEVVALGALDYNEVDPHRCILYTSQEPCPLCLGALYMSGVRELRFAARDPYAGSADMLGTTPYLSRKPIRVVPPSSPALESVVSALAFEFGFRYSQHSTPLWLESWREVLADAVTLGEAILRTGRLQLMREAGADAAAVIDGLAAMLRES